MSIIPKISVGLPKKREKFSLNFDNSTTSNVGNIQPTMCREMVPNEKFSVKVNSLVRLASMPLPTFGRVSLRHNHVFVSYRELYEPFDAMLSAQHYSSRENTFIPTQVPHFTFASLLPYIVAYSDMTIYPRNNLTSPFKIDRAYIPTYNSEHDVIGKALAIETEGQARNRVMRVQLEALQTALNAIRSDAKWFGSPTSRDLLYNFGAGSLLSDDYGVIRAGDFYVRLDGSASGSFTLDFNVYIDEEHGYTEGNTYYDSSGTIITPEGADLITTIGDYMVCLKFKAPIKRLRTIFIGLGYQFEPYHPTLQQSVMKLLAYYKGWFSLFCPIRQKSFQDTNCYKLCKAMSESNGSDVSASYTALWNIFIEDLIRDCYYYLPMDYFSMATTSPQQSNTDTYTQVTSVIGFSRNGTQYDAGGFAKGGLTQDRPDVAYDNGANTPALASGSLSPLALRIAQRLLTFCNKNTVIGRSIRDYLKVHYGVADVDPIDSGDVVRIGSSRVSISISDVMSTAENSQGYLGEYGGKGIGYGDSEKFDFTADKFGCWITYTVIVPESGYYQGYLKENRHLDRYQFFMPEFDALGYQVLERGELMSDWNCDSEGWNPRTGFSPTAAFGLVPRYSEYKVGRNIVNGDLSLVGLYNSMSPYTLDRRLSAGLLSAPVLRRYVDITQFDYEGNPEKWMSETVGGTIYRPDFVPSVVYDDFRRIDPSDHLGQYNRIFNYGKNDLDHFIIHNIFEVTAVAPMKSLTTSFDTYGEEDEGSVDVSKA